MLPVYSTYHDYVRHWAQTMPKHAAFICNGKATSYAEMLCEAERLASWLIVRGIQPGDRILYALPARPAFFALMAAASMTGAVLVGVGLTYPAYEIASITRNVKPKMAFARADAACRMAETGDLSPADIVVVGEGVPRGYCSYADCLPAMGPAQTIGVEQRCESVQGDDPFFIIHTSGTTGVPKGAVITQSSAIASALAQAKGFCAPDGCTPDDIYQHQVPTNHVSGCIEWGVAPVVSGCTSILNDAFDARTILENTERYHATILAGVPAMWNMMFRLMDSNEYDLASVRFTMVGAAPGSPEMFERILQIAPVCSNPLGMTETSGFCTYSEAFASASELAASVGRPIAGLECKIVGEDGSTLPTGEIGRICYRGPSVTQGYYLNPQATEAAFDGEGFFVTDDLACFDDKGNICLRGRSDDMFLSRGFCVYPAEIEMALLADLDVEMAAVLPIPHKVMGQVARAYVVPRAGAQLKGAKLRRALEKRLADYKVPRSFKIVDALPLTALGKPRKKELAAQIAIEFSESGAGS